jgi:hypothetical protein
MDARTSLQRFARGEVTRAQLEHDLKGLVEIDFSGPVRAVRHSGDIGVEVEVRPEDVVQRLQSYLRGEMSAQTLSEWASAILMIDAYIYQGHEFSEVTRGEEGWLVVQELSSPEVHGEISPASAHRQIDRLRRKGRRGPAG